MMTLVKLSIEELAEVIFTSNLSICGAKPAPAEVALVAEKCLHAHHDNVSECVEELAAEYGDHPDQASARMRQSLEMARYLRAYLDTLR